MTEEIANSESLLSNAQKEHLYEKLIIQLNKDLVLANTEVEFEKNIDSTTLKQTLHEFVYKLINERFSDYLNLLYIVDVSEQQVKKLDGSDTLLLSEQITYLILKREWQKVWYKNKY
ncbi:hypothetical protein [Zhouia amylolytica]|uniref:Uncharacterized protein n=1 Tax=Zhouia amylolytica AD3 TaxID=1286632 RepID=W2UM91_9FLAO|nr:hypothetical protein [Zhouia amylolytica]ETN94452.1 hypothetical protein P278_23950 [Zhouia amylolytica AD3]MCQ0110326.1 hypothetical protein [Zhouia amylolytica]